MKMCIELELVRQERQIKLNTIITEYTLHFLAHKKPKVNNELK